MITVELPDFLLARFAEEEAKARAAAEFGPEWQGVPGAVWAGARAILASDGQLPRSGRGVGEIVDEAAPHVLAWDPARVLAKCAADRQIVESCREDYNDSLTSGDDTTSLAEEVLHSLALPYADHEDYQEDWKP